MEQNKIIDMDKITDKVQEIIAQELPVTIGSYVYNSTDNTDKPTKFEITGIKILASKWWCGISVFFFAELRQNNHYELIKEIQFELEDIGTNVFLSEEEFINANKTKSE